MKGHSQTDKLCRYLVTYRNYMKICLFKVRWTVEVGNNILKPIPTELRPLLHVMKNEALEMHAICLKDIVLISFSTWHSVTVSALCQINQLQIALKTKVECLNLVLQ